MPDATNPRESLEQLRARYEQNKATVKVKRQQRRTDNPHAPFSERDLSEMRKQFASAPRTMPFVGRWLATIEQLLEQRKRVLSVVDWLGDYKPQADTDPLYRRTAIEIAKVAAKKLRAALEEPCK